jgi:myo-inositol 2-dehydrogenase / D-chiro-inositol 1-dehydrogenase
MVRIGVVGAGRMGRVHIRAVQASDEVDLAAIVEPHVPSRYAVSSCGVPVYETPEHLLEAGGVDGVLIAAPSNRHPELVALFAGAGIPLLCEKPLGVRASDAAQATDAAARHNILLQVGYWRRFVPALRELRVQIAGGELGEISQLACMQWDAQPPSERFRASSGGIAVDMGVHEFDQARWLLGQEIDWLAAVPAGPTPGGPPTPEDPDAATILAELSGGACLTISLGRRFPYEDSCWVEVWGTERYRRVPFMWDTDGERVFLDAMIAQVEAFARALGGGPREGAGGADAIVALQVAERVAASLLARAKCRVKDAVVSR